MRSSLPAITPLVRDGRSPVPVQITALREKKRIRKAVSIISGQDIIVAKRRSRFTGRSEDRAVDEYGATL